MFIKPANPAACPYCIPGCDSKGTAILPACHDTVTPVILLQYINHCCPCQNFYIGKFLDRFQQPACNLFPRDIFVKQDSRPGMGTLSGIGKFPVSAVKVHTTGDQLIYHLSGGTDHHIHRFSPVFIMTGLQGVLHKQIIILFIVQHADAALRQIRITVLRIILCQHQNLFLSRQVKSCKKPSNSCSHDHDICLFSFHFLLNLLSIRSPPLCKGQCGFHYFAVSSIRFKGTLAFSRRLSSTLTSPLLYFRQSRTFSSVTFFIDAQVCPPGSV